MAHSVKFLTLGLMASSLTAQERPATPTAGPVFSQSDTAFVFIAVAEHLADSLPTWYPRKLFQLDIPQFPRNAGLQRSLAGALGRAPFLLQCADLVHCAERQAQVVRLDSLENWDGYSVKVSIKLPVRRWHGWNGSPGLGWSWPEWTIAAENELFLNMGPYMIGGCSVPMLRAVFLHRDSEGWVVTQKIHSLRLCA